MVRKRKAAEQRAIQDERLGHRAATIASGSAVTGAFSSIRGAAKL
jgi:hypothetical protein